MQFAISDFIEEQRKGLAELLENLSKSRVAAARTAARQSAARIKELNGRVRALARSGVQLTTVSQNAAQGLIELHAEIVNTALTEAAARIERLAYTESVRDLARLQAEVLQGARERIVEDIARAVTILKDAADDARKAVAPVPPVAGKASSRKASARTKTRPRSKSAARPRSAAGPRRAPRRTTRR
jgi:hypothetical protein